MSVIPFELNEKKVFRTQAVAGFTGDPDWGATQNYDEVVTSGGMGIPRSLANQKVAVTIELYDAAGAKVTTGRGSFDIQPIMLRRGDANEKAVHDSTASAGIIAFRRQILDDVFAATDGLGVRISNPVFPAGATELRLVGEVIGVS